MAAITHWPASRLLLNVGLLLSSAVATTCFSNDTTPDLTRLPAFESKPRVFILTDILNEPDDSESLVRYLLYSNEFDTRGICTVTSEWQPNATHPEAVEEIVNAYGSVVDILNNHVNPEAQYQNASELLSLITTGPAVYGKAALSLDPSEGALLLVQRLEETTQPLYVPVWGGTNVLAQALQYIQQTYSEDDATALRSRLRVYAISDQDDTGGWIRNNFPDVFYIVSIHAWNSYSLATWAGISKVVSGANSTKVSAAWLASNIQIGTLGSQYPTPEFLMEGDSPSFLYLIQNGLGNPEFPNWGSWGGRYGRISPGSMLFADTFDAVVGVDDISYTDNKATIYRWRDHYQNDFAARMSWTLTSNFWNASHPPVPVVNGTQGPAFLNLTVASGETVVLDAGQSYDPDHPDTAENLTFEWYQYVEPTEFATNAASIPRVSLLSLSPPAGSNGTLASNDAGFQSVVVGESIEVTVPSDETGLAYHVILQLSSDSAELPLRRYLRVILNIP